MSFGNSDRAVFSDLKPLDGGQSLDPMSTVLGFFATNFLLARMDTHMIHIHFLFPPSPKM